ncbi:MAG TPA: monovalent cation:proton antiporter-2 (CPA2) family protein [Gammaproteobacteria bacterium]|nr:monovalent cation:proton antiporter-2 (CPA2) family protein [Gammaproteobacteria bacterium]
MYYLLDAVLLFAVAVLVVPVFQYLRLGSVLGFLVAGALVGPSGFAVIDNVDDLRHFSELGVVFLLFIIGVELRPKRLWRMRWTVFGLGTLQVVVTGAVLTPLALAVGYGPQSALLVGFGLALSSTAFVLQLLSERKALASPVGRHAFGILLLQDLAVVPLLALVPLLASPETPIGRDVGLAAAEAALILGSVFLVGRRVLKPVLHLIARHGTNEIFAASGILLVLGTALVFEHAGLSMAMGAFVAGLLIADSEYRHQILADIQPFRGILLGLFFMAVGMSVRLDTLLTEPVPLATAVAVLLLVKGAVVFAATRLFGLPSREAFRAGLLLAQSGEFGFVLFGAAVSAGVITTPEFARLILIVALSMAVTPLLAAASDWLERPARGGTSKEPAEPGETDEVPRVIVAGFGRVGRRITRLLHAANIPCAAVDRDPDKVHAGRAEGLPVVFGDAARPEVLRAVGAERAQLLLVALDSTESAEQLIGSLHTQFPELPIYTRARDSDACGHLVTLGATGVISENLEASLQLARVALDVSGADAAQREQLLDSFRSDYYQCLPPAVADERTPGRGE